MDLDNTIETAGEVIKSSSNKEQATVRHQHDMLSDSWLSKNIRPIVVLWALVMLTFILIAGVLGLQIVEQTAQTIGTISIMAIAFYFPMRSAEKYLKKRAKNL